MKKFLAPLLMILFVISGAVAADFIKSSGGEQKASSDGHDKTTADKHAKKKDHGASSDKKKSGHEKKKKSHKKSAKKDSHGKKDNGHGDATSGDTNTYLKFKRQFVVPVMTAGAIEALIIINLNLELDDQAPDNAYSFEPKLRDAITRELLGLSNRGIFGDNLTSAGSYEEIRQKLLTACRYVIKEGITDILILDIARQEQ